MSRSLMSRSLAVSAGIVLMSASAALAHPSFNPNAIPAGEAVASQLVIPHGCAVDGGRPTGGEAALPTVRIDLQYTEQVAIVPGEVDGWSVANDGDAIVWTDAGGATTEPILLPVTLTVASGAAGDLLYLAAYQECEGGDSFRWIALPGEDGDPAVKIELTSGATGTVEIDDDGHAGHGGTATPVAPDASVPTLTEDPTPQDPATDLATDATTDAAAGSDGSGATVVTLVVVLAIMAAAAGGAMAVRRRRNP